MPPTLLDSFVSRSMGAALWDARPTKTDARARHLAAALGYPTGWRVVREIQSTETHPVIIVDRIYSDDPRARPECDRWYHHAAAQRAAAEWETLGDRPGPHAFRGGHLLARRARYAKGDKVQAFFEDEWWDARIVRRKEHVTGFRYQVHYAADNSKQSGVPEEWIRPRPEGESGLNKQKQQQQDPVALATQLGFGEGWQAECKGGKRYRITDPDGRVYTSKAKAMVAYDAGNNNAAAVGSIVRDEGDPPWRTAGHAWLGRRVERRHAQAVTARRRVTVVQHGTVTGHIAATDVDRAGNPGYRSERTGEPAALFHVDYDDDPNHPYPSHLMAFQDLEEFEVRDMLMDDENGETPAAADPAAPATK